MNSPRRPFPFLPVLALAGLAACASTYSQESAPKNAQEDTRAAYAGLIDDYCTDCHNLGEFAGGLVLEDVDWDHLVKDADVWEKVIHKLDIGVMPPPGRKRPAPATALALVEHLVTTLDQAAAADPEPGRFPIHRLNRTEYGNAIRDLFGFEVDVASLLPADSSTHGFDNISDVLKTSPLLLERYLAVAQQIAATAVGDVTMAPQTIHYAPSPYRSHNRWIEGLPLGTRGGLVVDHYFPVDGVYEFRPELWEAAASTVRGLEGFDEPFEYQMLIDGEIVHTAQIGGVEDDALSNRDQGSATAQAQARLRLALPVTAGLHRVGFTFRMKSFAIEQRLLQPFKSDLPLGNDGYGWPRLAQVFLTGPLEAAGPGDTPVRRAIFTCRPGGVISYTDCARQILARFARRAWSRPVEPGELSMLVDFYIQGSDNGRRFERGIQLAFTRMLSGPEFLFRREVAPPANVAPGAIYAIDAVTLASRLALFLWSSIPDDELLEAAIAGELAKPDALDAQVRRMLADPRAKALIDNFAGQWLQLGNVGTKTPDLQAFPDWDDNLRRDMLRETRLFLRSVLLEDQSVLALIDADYTFLNGRLADHYGIDGVFGDVFRRVALADSNRGGLLGHGSVLFETSVATRTSPVFRGKWIMTNIFNSPPAPPPPGVPSLDDGAAGIETSSVRERLERHREDPACASCHLTMDPPGFALENFDPLGRWRDEDNGQAVDAAASLADGVEVNGPRALKEAILQRPEIFVRTLTEKLMTYALARGLEAQDMPAVRAIVREAENTDYRFSALVSGVVNSIPFTMKRQSVNAVAMAGE